MRGILACLVVAPLLCGPAAALELYKWVDEDGSVTYSQQQPPGQQAETVEVRVSGPSDEAAKSELENLTERASEASRDRQFAATAAAELQEREERIRKNCEIARENKRVLESAPRVQATDDAGNPYFIDDASRQERLAQAQQQIEDFCQ